MMWWVRVGYVALLFLVPLVQLTLALVYLTVGWPDSGVVFPLIFWLNVALFTVALVGILLAFSDWLPFSLSVLAAVVAIIDTQQPGTLGGVVVSWVSTESFDQMVQLTVSLVLIPLGLRLWLLWGAWRSLRWHWVRRSDRLALGARSTK